MPSASIRAGVIGALVVLLAGCGAKNGTVPTVSSAQAKAHQRSGSSGDLVYAVTAKGIVILTYPDWSIVARISGFRNWYSICSDPNSGNVFAVTGTNEIDEFAHGGTTPIATLILPAGYPNACAVDPTTGNLAVVAGGTPTELSDSVFIYPQAQGTPAVYSDKRLPGLVSPVYDGSGNLFIGAQDRFRAFRIAELKAGHNDLLEIKVEGAHNVYPHQLQWDGTYLVFLDTNGPGYGTTVNQVTVNGRIGTIVRTFLLTHCQDDQFSIFNGSLLSFYYPPKQRDHYAVAAWPYPAGGKPSSRHYGITQGREDYTYDLTVSVKPSNR